jgi:hypothetical protein
MDESEAVAGVVSFLPVRLLHVCVMDQCEMPCRDIAVRNNNHLPEREFGTSQHPLLETRESLQMGLECLIYQNG